MTANPVIVDERLLANLVADQSPSLRLVVLNSCKSGRSTPEDPQAGVALDTDVARPPRCGGDATFHHRPGRDHVRW